MIPFPAGKFHIIYADPPWAYDQKAIPTKAGKYKNAAAADHYPTMSPAELAALPIADLAEPNCALFLWACFPKLEVALETGKAWGFWYRTLGFSWIKTYAKCGRPKLGFGSYAKSNCEVCLFFRRGNVGRLLQGKPPSDPKDCLRVISNKVSSVVMSPIGRHSAKPPEVRDRIVQLFGDVSRIELFARESAPGWAHWGNEVL
jgi:N6-adenosine-specific RNA methylase IME4